MPRSRRKFDGTFKAKAALDAIRGLKTTSELVSIHKVHATQIALWTKQLQEVAISIFESPSTSTATTNEPSSSELYEQIGRLKVELDWLKKKWPRTVAERRSWIDPRDRLLSVRWQCELLGLHRSNVYYDPIPVSEDDLRLMRLIDEEYGSGCCDRGAPRKGQSREIAATPGNATLGVDAFQIGLERLACRRLQCRRTLLRL